ncbi:MAG: biliverdin-producing heme oxygenase [Deltaproteobacteria bacterium]|nr:biliverdin-producing heme oxygenase [Deltaproteobacteria bacterium]
MIDRLHAETRANHADADADVDLLFRDQTSVTDYLMFLTRQYGFEAPLESACAMTPNLDLMIELRERQKAGLLAQDLLGLGLRPNDIAMIPQCLRVPQFRGAAEALGWMYVVERATLAHSVIRRHLMMRLPRAVRDSSMYLQAYAGSVGKRWRDFGMVLDDVARHPAIAERIVDAANDAFRTQRRWIMHDQRSSRAAMAI